jgi:hypothetical protein
MLHIVVPQGHTIRTHQSLQTAKPKQEPLAAVTPTKASISLLPQRHCLLRNMETSHRQGAHQRRQLPRSYPRCTIISRGKPIMLCVAVAVVAGTTYSCSPTLAANQLSLLHTLNCRPHSTLPKMHWAGLQAYIPKDGPSNRRS